MAWQNYPLVALAVALVASLFGNIQPDPTHFCESKQVKSYCFSLSKTRCYRSPEKDTWKVCDEGWQAVTVDEGAVQKCPKVQVIAYTDIGKFFCDGIGPEAKCTSADTLG